MRHVQIIAAPSILGLKPTGVQQLPESLLKAGFAQAIGAQSPIIDVPTLNDEYNYVRDETTGCLNVSSVLRFSSALTRTVSDQLTTKQFQLVLGGDCSILLGIMPALKQAGEFGLLFMDAHADFLSTCCVDHRRTGRYGPGDYNR